jgi:hypothetical protein
MTQPVAYTRYRQPVWTNANLAKDFVKVKTYSDLIVLKQDAHDKLGEPARWVLYAADFDKSPYPAMHKARAEQWMNMYSILDRSTFEESCVRADQGVDSRPIRFECIARCILTAYTANCDDASAYNSRLSTAHKSRVALGGNTTITVDDDFSQAEMMHGLAQQAVQQALKTEVQKLDEELGNDYKANQHVYRAMIAQMNREEREDEEGY